MVFTDSQRCLWSGKRPAENAGNQIYIICVYANLFGGIRRTRSANKMIRNGCEVCLTIILGFNAILQLKFEACFFKDAEQRMCALSNLSVTPLLYK